MKCGAPSARKTSGRSIALLRLPQMDCVSHCTTAPSEMRPNNWFLGIYLQALGCRLIASTSGDQTKGRIAPFFIIVKRASALTSTENRDPQTPVFSYRPQKL